MGQAAGLSGVELGQEGFLGERLQTGNPSGQRGGVRHRDGERQHVLTGTVTVQYSTVHYSTVPCTAKKRTCKFGHFPGASAASPPVLAKTLAVVLPRPPSCPMAHTPSFSWGDFFRFFSFFFFFFLQGAGMGGGMEVEFGASRAALEGFCEVSGTGVWKTQFTRWHG